jgi:hypothetical protein
MACTTSPHSKEAERNRLCKRWAPAMTGLLKAKIGS